MLALRPLLRHAWTHAWTSRSVTRSLASGSSNRWLGRASRDPYGVSAAPKPGGVSGRRKNRPRSERGGGGAPKEDPYAPASVSGGKTVLAPPDHFSPPPPYSPSVSRASHKLDSILHSHLLALPAPATVLDLGAAPGGWSDCIGHYLSCWPGGAPPAKPLVVAVDLLRHPVPPALHGFETHQLGPETAARLPSILARQSGPLYAQLTHDFLTLDLALLPKPDLLLSDIAPSTTGVSSLDTDNQNQMALRVLALAEASLKRGGSAVVKIYNAGDRALLEEIGEVAGRVFRRVKRVKPRGSRGESREMFLLGLGRR